MSAEIGSPVSGASFRVGALCRWVQHLSAQSKCQPSSRADMWYRKRDLCTPTLQAKSDSSANLEHAHHFGYKFADQCLVRFILMLVRIQPK